MSQDDQHLDGTVANKDTTTPDEKRESQDASDDFESLFSDDPQDDSQKDQPASREELKRLEKGIKVLASKIGREKQDKVEVKPTEAKEVKTEGSSVLKNLYFKANPEAQIIWDEVEKEAKLLGKDPFELFEASSYFKGEAKARTEAKAEEEKNKAKIAKPSSQTGSSQTDISKVKPEDVDKLPPAQRIEWMKAQARKEREQGD